MGAKRLKFLLGVCCNLSLLSKLMEPCNLWKLETLVNNDGNGKWPNSWKFQAWNRIELVSNSYWNHPKLLQFLCVAPSCKLTTWSKERDGGARTFAATAACRAKMVLKSGKLPPIVGISCHSTCTHPYLNSPGVSSLKILCLKIGHASHIHITYSGHVVRMMIN